MAEREWIRFLANAARVRALTVHRGPNLEKQLISIRLSFKGKLALCRLQKLCVSTELLEKEIGHIAAVLGSPHLTEFWMEGEHEAEGAETIGTALEWLAELHPTIPAIHVPEWRATYAEYLLEKFTHLEELSSAAELGWGMMTSLADSRTLRSLKAKVSTMYLMEFPWKQHRFNDFKALRELRLHGIIHVTELPNFLHSIVSQDLQCLELRFDTDEGRIAAVMVPVLERISTFKTLHELELRSSDIRYPDADPHAVTYDIQPLLRLPRLRSLRLDLLGFRHAIIDEAIPEFAQAWPDLEVFQYLQSIFTPEPPLHLTLNALHLFAHHFPRLRSLTLDLDATVSPPLPPQATSMNNIDLDLTSSLIDHRTFADVAAYISRTLPRAHIVLAASEPEGSDGKTYWSHIRGVLPMLTQHLVNGPSTAHLSDVTETR